MSRVAVLDHVTLVTDDFAASRELFDAVLGVLGWLVRLDYADPEAEEDDPGEVAAVGYGPAEDVAVLWLVSGTAPTRGGHVAVAAPELQLVHSAFNAGQAAGGRVVQAPREWELHQLGYFGAQLADHNSNVIEIVYRAPTAPVGAG
jgi:catechol 2,3-dioxygenase-like lactoylglutathione lyase family enzyme